MDLDFEIEICDNNNLNTNKNIEYTQICLDILEKIINHKDNLLEGEDMVEIYGLIYKIKTRKFEFHEYKSALTGDEKLYLLHCINMYIYLEKINNIDYFNIQKHIIFLMM